ncbi:MAG: hypothetical protein ACLGH8_01580 [Bacteroidia bacterium]
MEISDFLTILGIALAVWALIPNKERRFILLFFSKYEILLIFIALLFIHILMSFEWIISHWTNRLSIFVTKYGIPSTTWAYIISIITISYPIIKVTYTYFSRSKVNELIDLYISLLKENELDILTNYIQKYHIDDIRIYLIGKSKLQQKDAVSIVLRRTTESDLEYKELIKPKRIFFAQFVYGYILQNEIFIKNAANKYPELFAEAIKGIRSVKAANPDFVNLYIQLIFENQNQSFIDELKILNESYDSVQERTKYFNIPICEALFVNTEASYKNNIWYSIGENTIKALKYDIQQKEFLLKSYDSIIEGELWNYKIKISIVYFNYMIRETIYRDSGYHMWLYYFKNYVEELISIISYPNSLDHEKSYPTFAHFILNELFETMRGWIELSVEQKNDWRVIDTIRCLGNCLDSLVNSDNNKISEKHKIEQFDNVISLYFDLENDNNNSGAKTSREWIEKLFLNLKTPDNAPNDIFADDQYKNIIKQAWKSFDKIPYKGSKNDGSTDRFTERVLNKLNIDI